MQLDRKSIRLPALDELPYDSAGKFQVPGCIGRLSLQSLAPDRTPVRAEVVPSLPVLPLLWG